MKTKTLMLVAGFSLALVLCAQADDKAVTDAKKDKAPAKPRRETTAEAARPKSETLETGSLIKHKVRRTGQITDGFSQVIVLDRTTIENSGATSVRQLLNRQGAH